MLQRALSQYLQFSYKKILKDQLKISQVQEKIFQRLKEQLEGTFADERTELGRAENLQQFAKLAKVRTYDDYSGPIHQAIRSHDFSNLFDDSVGYVGLSSATTAPHSKALPYNDAMIRAWDRFQMSMASIIEASSPVRFLKDQRLTWGSTPILEEIAGVKAGYVSGFLSMKTPWLMKSKAFPKRETLVIDDMPQKTARMPEELKDADLRLISGVPSYLLNVLEALRQSWGVTNLAEKFPNLQTCVYSATAISPWKEQIDEVVGRPLKYIGAYAATEGCFGYEIPELNACKNGIYSFHLSDIVFLFRLLNREGGIVTVADLEAGDEVEVLITTPNGLVNYSVGDKLRIVSVAPSILFEVLGRIGQGMNIAAEKVSQLELSRAVELASRDLGTKLRHFFVHPGQSTAGRPAYSWTLVLESGTSEDRDRWSIALDSALKSVSDDYREARDDLQFIDSPVIRFVPKNLLDDYFQRKSSRGQLKVKSIFESEESFGRFLNEMKAAVA